MTTIVHVVNGDATAAPLAEAELPGEILIWADALDRGPVLPTGDAEHRAARAAYWAQDLGTDAAAIDRDLAAADAALDAGARTAEEIVLWYEHDLFDQLALVRILARLGRVPPTAPLTLVSIDRHPDVPDFQGFGQLEAYQLASLWPRRIPLTGASDVEGITHVEGDRFILVDEGRHRLSWVTITPQTPLLHRPRCR